jgi:hypothetical protein
MKTKGKVCDYIKANRKGSREAEYETSTGWTSQTKVHKNKKKYSRKDRSWQNHSGLFSFKTHSKSNKMILNQQYLKLNNHFKAVIMLLLCYFII